MTLTRRVLARLGLGGWRHRSAMRFPGVVVDGTGADPFVADVVIEDDRIAEIRRAGDGLVTGEPDPPQSR